MKGIWYECCLSWTKVQNWTQCQTIDDLLPIQEHHFTTNETVTAVNDIMIYDRYLFALQHSQINPEWKDVQFERLQISSDRNKPLYSQISFLLSLQKYFVGYSAAKIQMHIAPIRTLFREKYYS